MKRGITLDKLEEIKLSVRHGQFEDIDWLIKTIEEQRKWFEVSSKLVGEQKKEIEQLEKRYDEQLDESQQTYDFFNKKIEDQQKEINRLLDARIAVSEHDWKWENAHGIRYILVPPDGDEKRMWTAIWDNNGIPHYLPKYSQEV